MDTFLSMQHFSNIFPLPADYITWFWTVFYTFNMTTQCYWKIQLRTMFYSMMVTTEDEGTQKNGMVGIIFHLSRLTSFVSADRESAWGLVKLLREGLPYKAIGTHACYNDPFIRPLIALGQMAADTFARIRVRSHSGMFLLLFSPSFILSPFVGRKK